MKRASLALLATLLAPPAFAQSAQAVIDAGVGANSQGRIAINQAAGVGNAQANLAALAHAQEGLGLADTHSDQRAANTHRAVAADAAIGAGAFDGVSGAFSLNQAAGDSNLQLNTLSIGSGGGSLIALADDAALADTATTGTSTEGAATATPDRRAVIDLDAFRGGQGVVQVNQTAGVGNLSTNAIVLQLPGSTP